MTNETRARGDDNGRSPPAPPLLVTASEARRLLGIGNTKFWSLVSSDTITTVQVGRRRQVLYASLIRLIES